METDTILLPGMADLEPSEKSPLSPNPTRAQPMKTLEGIKSIDTCRYATNGGL